MIRTLAPSSSRSFWPVAIIAAIVLTMRKRPGLKQQNITEQVMVKRSDRVRLVKMAAEKPDDAAQ